MYYDGPTTHIAAEDMDIYTLVRIKPLSTTQPSEVEPVNLTWPAIGITQSPVKEGEAVAVNPLNYAAYQRVKYVYFNGCDVGDTLYATSDGAVTDVDTGGTSAGRALEAVTDPDTPFIRIGASGAGGFGRAEDIEVADAGGYYPVTPKTIESCLSTIGAGLTLDVKKTQYYNEAVVGNIALPSSYIGGRGSSDLLTNIRYGASGTSPDVISSWEFDGNVTAVYLFKQFMTKPSGNIIVDSENPMDISIINASFGDMSNVTPVYAYILFPDGTNIVGPDYDVYGSDGDFYEDFIFTSTDDRFNTNPFFQLVVGIRMSIGLPTLHIQSIVTYYNTYI